MKHFNSAVGALVFVALAGVVAVTQRSHNPQVAMCPIPGDDDWLPENSPTCQKIPAYLKNRATLCNEAGPSASEKALCEERVAFALAQVSPKARAARVSVITPTGPKQLASNREESE